MGARRCSRGGSSGKGVSKPTEWRADPASKERGAGLGARPVQPMGATRGPPPPRRGGAHPELVCYVRTEPWGTQPRRAAWKAYRAPEGRGRKPRPEGGRVATSSARGAPPHPNCISSPFPPASAPRALRSRPEPPARTRGAAQRCVALRCAALRPARMRGVANLAPRRGARSGSGSRSGSRSGSPDRAPLFRALWTRPHLVAGLHGRAAPETVAGRVRGAAAGALQVRFLLRSPTPPGSATRSLP